MCGIFAALSRRNGIVADYGPLLERLRHRGPDDRASAVLSVHCGDTTAEARAWLGHQRLSIIDLSAAGRQPMATTDGRYTIVFNGEIYNYRELRDECRAAGQTFRTNTDTEVLLQAWRLWGEASLTRLVGMFAFVVIDRDAGTATLVRDCFGIKPLYYVVGQETVFVCSEVMPLVATGAVSESLNADIAFEYVRFGATRSNDRTILRDIASVPPAHLAVFDFRTGALGAPRRYWTLRASQRSISFRDAVDECRMRFLDNVRLHLRSDVPIGAALSGGLDSSAIVCAMRTLEPELDLKTFSYISAEPGFSEERWVDLVHEQVGGECHKIRSTGEDVGDALEQLVHRQGEPFASASIFAQFQVFQRARAEGISVTLDGQGADELLGGYWPHVASAAAERVRAGDLSGATRIVRHADLGALRMSGLLAQSLLPPGVRALARRVVGRSFVPDFFDSEWLRAMEVNPALVADALVGRYPTLKAQLIDSVEHGSLPPLLRYADRNSMAFSVEARVPFLTTDFAEFLLSLPASFLVSVDVERKYVFREAMKGLIPEPIRLRRDKIGFVADDEHWLRASRLRFSDVWGELASMPLFSRRDLQRFVDGFWSGEHGKSQQMWRLLVFGLWWRDVRRTRAGNGR